MEFQQCSLKSKMSKYDAVAKGTNHVTAREGTSLHERQPKRTVVIAEFFATPFQRQPLSVKLHLMSLGVFIDVLQVLSNDSGRKWNASIPASFPTLRLPLQCACMYVRAEETFLDHRLITID